MGGEDSAYNRNVVVKEFSAKIDALQAADPSGYIHRCTVYPGLSHNMQNRESEVIPIMAAEQRVVWPKRVVWKQDSDVPHRRFYWMDHVTDPTQPNQIYAAHIEGQNIEIEQPATGSLDLRLSDELLDLDKPIEVTISGRKIFAGKVSRSLAAIVQSLEEREDPDGVAPAQLHVTW
jgi:hypothetical protein